MHRDLIILRLKAAQPHLKGLTYEQKCAVLRERGDADLIRFLRKPEGR